MFTICLQFVHTLYIYGLYNVLKDKGKGYSKRVSRVYVIWKDILNWTMWLLKLKKVKSKLQPLRLRDLSDCYKKPSDIKMSIYDDWANWLMKLNDISTDMHFHPMTVVSYNCMMFTLGCNVYNNECQLIGQLHITKTRQEFWII